MTFLQRVKSKFKEWVSGGQKKKKEPPKARVVRTNRDARNETVSSRTSQGNSYNRRAMFDSLRGNDKQEREEKRVRENAFKATTRSYKSLSDSIKKDVSNDPKVDAAKQSRERARKRLDAIKQERKEYHEATGHRYDVGEKGISSEEKTRRRQAQKSGAYDVEREKFETEKHPVAASAARGALSGVTFGASELALRNSKARKESGAEEFYQKHKNKAAETVGEIGGSLVSFGGTAGATEKLATKVGGKAIERGAERLAENAIVKGAAKRSVKRAVKKGLVKEGTEELIKQVGKDKAKKIASAVGTDIVQNATTGLLYDFNKASAEHKIGSSDWWKEMGESAALNAAVTGGVAGASALRGGKRAAVEAADELGRLGKAGFVKHAPDAKVSLKRKRKTNVALPNERPREVQIDDALDDMMSQANTVEDYMALGFGRGDAELLARPIRIDDAAKGEARFNPYDLDTTSKGTPLKKGNIKSLAEKLKTDEAMPRQRNAQFASAPRSAERVDTSIEGLSKRLDELKAQTPQTDRERRAIETKIHDVEERLNRAEWRKEGGADMDAMRKAYRGEYAGFDMSKSTNSHQSDVLEGKVKGKTATVVEMSPDEYMERAYRQIFKKPSKRGSAFAEIPETSEKVTQYAEAMRNGEKFPLPYLDYTNAGQEGRHRALAAKMAGIDKIPVVVIDDATNPKSIIEDVAEMTAKNADETAEAAARQPYAMVDEVAEGIEPDTPLDEARRVASDMSEGRTPRDVDINEATQAVDDTLPAGTQKARQSFEKIRGEKVEKGETPPTTKEIYDAYKEYHISQGSESRRKQSKAAASQINMMTEDAEKALRQRLVESGDADYDTIFTPELYDQISREFKDEGEYWISRISDGADDLTKINASEIPEMQARCEYLMAVLDPSADEAAESAYYSAMKLAKDIASKSGQTLNIRRNFVKLTRAGKIESTVDDLVSILDSSLGFNKKYKGKIPAGKYNRINFIKGKLMDDPVMEKAITKVVDAKTPEEVSEAYTEMLLSLNRVNPKGGFDIIQEIRYLNMLGNPKTHIRNVFGSGFFAPIRQISNGIRSGIENSTALKSYLKSQGAEGLEKDITRHGHISLLAAKEAMVKNPTTEAGKEALKALERRAPELLGSAKYDTPKYVGRSKTLAGKAVDRISDFNSTLLTKEDDVFKRVAFRENYIKSYERYVRDGKPITDKVKKRIEAEAIQEANVATFNEYNKFANWLNKIEKNANNANAGVGARWSGRFVNALMPFTKVPANLMEQSVNYSPLGIARGLAEIKTAAQRSDAQLLNAAIDHFASGMTGTAIFASGMLLGKTTDMFTTNAGKNDPAAKFKKDRGVQNYSVTFKDPETGQGHSFTLDWLVPTSATFFSGVELANQLKGADGFNPMNVVGDWSIVASRLAEPVMETSMLSGLHGMLETMRGGYGDDDTKGAIDIIGRETVQSWLNSMIPTVLGQAARTAYKTDMQVAGDTDWEYWRNQVKSKAGLANTNILGEPLGADTDAYGNVKGDKGNTFGGAIKEGDKKALKEYGKSALKNFVSPSNIQRVDFSEVDNAKIAEYERRVKDGESPEELAYLFPKKQYKKKFKLAGEEVKMSNRDLSTYNQAKTTGGKEGMRFVLENIMFNRQTLDENGKKVPADSAYTKAQKEKLMSQFEGKSMRDVEKWLYEQPEFQKATDAERKKAIDGLWKLTKDTKAVASQRVGEQAVIKAQGGDVNEYNFKNEVTEKKREALQPLIEAGVVSYEEAVDFARNAGKTYYTENDEGGTSATYYNKKEMIQYLIDKGYSYEKAEALFNAFKNANAKPYSGNDLSSSRRRGYRRRGYRRYHRRGRGGGSKATAPKIKQSDYKASKQTYKDLASALKTSGRTSRVTDTTVKIEPPKVKFKKYEV